jgi:hypothetical protein
MKRRRGHGFLLSELLLKLLELGRFLLEFLESVDKQLLLGGILRSAVLYHGANGNVDFVVDKEDEEGVDNELHRPRTTAASLRRSSALPAEAKASS